MYHYWRIESLFVAFLLLSAVRTYEEKNFEYSKVMDEVINLKELTKKIRDSLSDTDEGQLAALKMLDASTKIPNGLLAGNIFDLGNFDECYGIKYEDIYGKYCLGTLPLTAVTEKYFATLKINTTLRSPPQFVHPRMIAGGLEGSIGFNFAACVPSNWSVNDIPGFLTYSEDLCYSKATEGGLSAGAMATIALLSICLAIIVASTVFDLILYYEEKDAPHELLIAFSVWSNGRKIFKSVTSPDQLLCINGIKAISMMWVIIGHEYSIILTAAPISNVFDLLEYLQEVKNMFIMGATVSVDTFFVVGGLVTVYTLLKSMDRGIKFNIPLYYVHRYFRLTPAFGIMILIHIYLLEYFGNGPLWGSMKLGLVKTCEKNWWSSLLYISNYVDSTNVCLAQTWYLSVDMQLFLLSPLILLLLAKWRKVTLALLSLLTVAGCAIPFAVGYTKNLTQMKANWTKDYYFPTHTRFGPYVIGMILGYYIHAIKKSKLNIRLSKLMVCTSWLVCLAGLVACVYAGHSITVGTGEDRWGNALFLAFNRPAWGVAVAGVIFLCVSGYGGPIDSFLSLPIFQILTKLSYSVFLVHYAVIVTRYSAMRNTLQFSDFNLMHAFWGDFIFTLALSIILCLSFESPIIILEKHLFGKVSAKPVVSEKKPEV